MRLLYLLITIPLAVFCVLFAISNRGMVLLELWPFPNQVPLPIWMLGLGALLVGFLFGGLITWLAAGRGRAAGRQATRQTHWQAVEIQRLERQLAEAKAAASEQQESDTADLSLPTANRPAAPARLTARNA